MKISIITAALLCCMSSIAAAHTGTITGTVIDSATTQPLTSANIHLIKTGIGTATSAMGDFLLGSVPEGSYEIRFSHLGYLSVIRSVTVKAGEVLQVDVLMIPASINLSEITVTAQLNPEETFTSLSQVDVELRPVKSAQDLLRIVPGVVTAQHAGGGKAEQIFLRGFDIDHGTDINISLDGIPVNMVTHAHGQGYADVHFLIPEVTGKVDFNKGPYYANKGDFGTAGYVAFKTKDRIDGNMLKLEVGEFNTRRVVSLIDVLGQQKSEQSLYLAGEFLYTDSYFVSPQNLNRLNLFAKYHGMISENNLLDFSVSSFNSKWNQSGQIPDRAVSVYNWIDRFGAIDDTEGGNTRRINANARLTTTLAENSFLTNQIYFTDYDFDLWSNFTFWLEDTLLADQIRQKEKRQIYGYQGAFTHFCYPGEHRLKSVFGVGIRQDIIHDSELSHSFQRNINLDTFSLGQVNQSNFNLFYSGTLQLTKKLSMNLALRYDQFIFDYVDDTQPVYTNLTENAGILSPKLKLFYDINPDFQLYLKSGSGFHSNDSRTILQKRTHEIIPRALGMDLGTFFKPHRNVLVNLAGWWLYMEEEFVYVGDAGIVEPSGETFRCGLDVSLRYQIWRDLFLDFDYNYARGHFINEPAGADRIPLAPEHTSIGGLTYRPVRGLNAGLRYRFIGDRPANEEGSVTALGYFVWDTGIRYRFTHFDLFLNIENIFNVDWNEAQFETESRLRAPDENGRFTGALEPAPISELHYTPGTPTFFKGGVSVFF